MGTLFEYRICTFIYTYIETLFTFIYLQYIYKIHELKNYCAHYAYLLMTYKYIEIILKKHYLLNSHLLSLNMHTFKST